MIDKYLKENHLYRNYADPLENNIDYTGEIIKIDLN
jgi:hypothetical protein